MQDLQESKEKLIKVATHLFASKGFRGTSIRDIANSMGMSISNIYHYFDNKEGLLLGILQHSSMALVRKLRHASDPNLEPLERFKRLLKSHIQHSAEGPKDGKIFLLDEEHLSQEGAEINRKLQREILEIYLASLRDLEASGYVQCRSLTILAFNIFGVLNWTLRWYRPDGKLTLDEITEEVVSFILYGALGGASKDAGPGNK
jgi:AcrR family transcriptional regulator